MEKIRTFIALEIPDELRRKLCLVQKQCMQRIEGVKWVNPDTIHLTLKFLGSIRCDRVEAVCTAMAQAAEGVGPFCFTVTGLGAFPSVRNPKVVWAGIQDDRIVRFQKKIEEALCPAGFSREQRPFTPHLTIGRVRVARAKHGLRTVLEEFSREVLGSFESSRLSFIQSDLQPAGPVYTVLKDIDL